MANTEGMSDEALSHLFTGAGTDESSISASSSQNPSKKSALQRRMELPIGERPAAQVIRQSNRRGVPGEKTSFSVASLSESPSESHAEPAQHAIEGTALSSPAVLGDVIERKSRRQRKQQTSSRTSSRFAQSAYKSGFPSVDVPLGELVTPKLNMPPSTNRAVSSGLGKRGAFSAVNEESSSDSPVNDESAVIRRQAQAMLEQMSVSEIKEHVQDLQAALSPETVTFLKRRGQERQKAHLKLEPVTPDKIGETEASPEHNNDTTAIPKEKERLAKVLSSIRTFEDMDAAYAQGVGEQMEWGQSSSDDPRAFETACDLLRSSVPRQTLWAARTVSQRLQQDVHRCGYDYALGNPSILAWPYPIILPVSLRCLLDTSISKVNGLVIHTYVLQSLYALLRLRCSMDHVHGMVECNGGDAAFLYQEYFLDDAIPTPPIHSCYSSAPMQPLSSPGSNNDSPVAYASTSSSASAQQDGQAFAQDPLWTMLSRMRILPRLAKLLQEEQLTLEAVLATCGILTLVAQRSPGAATAIVHHPTLLQDLTDRAFVHRSESGNGGVKDGSDVYPAVATIFLGCTLARQSRSAAKGLETVFIPRLLPLLAPTASTTNHGYHLQKWALVLWRTRLRYGLSLSDIPTMLTLAAPHCSLGPDHQRQESLAPHFFSAFTVALYCIRAVKVMGSKKEKVDMVNPDDRALMAHSGVWLSSCKQMALQHLVHASSMDEHEPSVENRLRWLQYVTSVLRYLDAWLVLSRSCPVDDTGEFKTEEVTEMEEVRCLQAMLALLHDEYIKKVVKVAFQYCFRISVSELPETRATELNFEVGSCAFVDALLVLAASISKSFISDGTENTLIKGIRDSFLACISHDKCGASESGSTTELCRRFWLNRTHGSLVRFIANSSPGPVDSYSIVLGLSTIGRLERGEESLATLLFSCDDMFQTQESDEKPGSTSPISTFFVRELCISDHARIQLDHSFKLRNALGLTSDKLGPFELQSLRSEAEGCSSPGSRQTLLPMGTLWLWRIFGGLVVDRELNRDAEQLFLTTLELVYELETTDEATRQNYARSLDRGGRLYFLMNLCFQPSLEGRPRAIIDSLIDCYMREIDQTAAFGFGKQCEQHSTNKEMSPGEAQTAEERQVVEALLDRSVPLANNGWSQKQLHSVMTFVGDLCDKFIEHGAEDTFFTKCLRSILGCGFPPKVRCDLIERLRDVPHLLSLSGEDLSPSLMVCLHGGLPSVDESIKDAPGVLDACVSLVSKGRSVSVADASFVVSWTTAMLTRSVAIHLEEGGAGGLVVSERRLQRLEPSIACRILKAAEEFLTSEGTKRDLVDACLRDRPGDEKSEEMNWKLALARLAEVRNRTGEHSV